MISIEEVPQFLFLLFLIAIFIGVPIYGWLDSRAQEQESSNTIRSFLTAIYPEAVVHNTQATFIHGRLNCSLKWYYHAPSNKNSGPRQSTRLSFQIPDWMAQALAKKDFTVNNCLPHQFNGFLTTSIPPEYTDFVEGRLQGRIPSVPFVNAHCRNKSMEEALQHDLKIYRILRKADPDDPYFRPSFTLKRNLFSFEMPTLIWSQAIAKEVIAMTMGVLKNAYRLACQIEGIQPVDRETMDAYFKANGRFLDSPNDSADAIVDEIEGELAKENAANGGEKGGTLALGDGDHGNLIPQRCARRP